MRNKSKLCDNHNTEIKNRRLMMTLCDKKFKLMRYVKL